jgi:predicted O-methyltransferase YrrM
VIPGFPVSDRSSGSFIDDSKDRPDSFDEGTINNARLRGVIDMVDHNSTEGIIDLSKYRPERPERYQLEGVKSLMYETDAKLIKKYMGICSMKFRHPDHVVFDIGTFHGASAIIMATHGHFDIITIDPFPSNTIKRSFEDHGVADQIIFHEIKSEDYVWPREKKIAFMLIDGLHFLAQVMFEFHYFSKFMPSGGFVAFHDVGKEKWPGFARVIQEAVEVDGWKMVDLEGYMCVLEKP